MQQYPLLATKLYIPPIRSELVSRPGLTQRLTAGLGQSTSLSEGRFARILTLVSAPAGFGKTTLISEWVHTMDITSPSIAFAWFSLDEGDNDPPRFLTYFIGALKQVDGMDVTFGEGALRMLQSSQPTSTEDILTSLINEVTAIPKRIILILDDYHLIETQPIHDVLTFILKHLPPQMHLVIVTRDDPPLPLARLRARGQLTELRAMDLRFSSSEAAEFLNRAMDLALSTEDIAALENRTEGWIAGLQLAAISMQGHKDTAALIKSFTGSHRFVLDYLIEEVLEQQSESIQTFLLQTAVLNRLTGSLCDAVRFGTTETPRSSSGTARTDQDNSQAILEILERANLFIIPLDEERRWYRYHHLFSDLLHQRLKQTLPEQLTILNQRASDWYKQNGLMDEAIEHALRVDDFERAATLIEELVDDFWGQGDHAKLRRLLLRLPIELVVSKPHLCIYHAWYSFISGQQKAVEQCLQAAQQALHSSTDQATETKPQIQDLLACGDKEKLRGRLTAIRVYMDSHRGDVPGMIQHARQALEYLPEQDRT